MGRITMLYVRVIKGGFRHRFRLAKLTRWPLLGRMMDHTFFGGDDIYVLPKEMPGHIVDIPLDLPDQTREDTVLPSEVVRHFVRALSLPLHHELLHMPHLGPLSRLSS